MNGYTHRDELMKSWIQEGELGEPGSDTEQKQIALLFSDGRVYELQDLRARASMFKLLAGMVRLMHQDVETLVRQVLIQQALAR